MTEEEAAVKAAADTTIELQIAEVEAELRFRRSVYGRRIAEGKMTSEQAARKTWRMLAVLGTLRRLQGPPRQGDLLG
jgi:hypothetical protein